MTVIIDLTMLPRFTDGQLIAELQRRGFAVRRNWSWLVKDRSGGVCETRGNPCLGPYGLPVCTKRGTQGHHILPKSLGGPNTLENLLHVCSSCHKWIHDNPVIAKRYGLLLDPEEKRHECGCVTRPDPKGLRSATLVQPCKQHGSDGG